MGFYKIILVIKADNLWNANDSARQLVSDNKDIEHIITGDIYNDELKKYFNQTKEELEKNEDWKFERLESK